MNISIVSIIGNLINFKGYTAIYWVKYGNNNVGQNTHVRLTPRSLMPYFQIFPADFRTCIMYIDRGLCQFDPSL